MKRQVHVEYVTQSHLKAKIWNPYKLFLKIFKSSEIISGSKMFLVQDSNLDTKNLNKRIIYSLLFGLSLGSTKNIKRTIQNPLNRAFHKLGGPLT